MDVVVATQARHLHAAQQRQHARRVVAAIAGALALCAATSPLGTAIAAPSEASGHGNAVQTTEMAQQRWQAIDQQGQIGAQEQHENRGGISEVDGHQRSTGKPAISLGLVRVVAAPRASAPAAALSAAAAPAGGAQQVAGTHVPPTAGSQASAPTTQAVTPANVTPAPAATPSTTTPSTTTTSTTTPGGQQDTTGQQQDANTNAGQSASVAAPAPAASPAAPVQATPAASTPVPVASTQAATTVNNAGEPCQSQTYFSGTPSQWQTPPGCYAGIYAVNPANYVSRSGFGWCNWWVEVMNPSRPDLLWGNYPRGTTPAPGATVVFAPGVQGASSAGHYSRVVAVYPGGQWFLVSEMNFYWRGGGWQKVSYRYVQTGQGISFIY